MEMKKCALLMSLFVCAVARQMMYSLQKYLASGKFNPEESVSFEMIDKLFK